MWRPSPLRPPPPPSGREGRSTSRADNTTEGLTNGQLPEKKEKNLTPNLPLLSTSPPLPSRGSRLTTYEIALYEDELRPPGSLRCGPYRKRRSCAASLVREFN